MLREPRGYPAPCCNVVLPPTQPEADAGFVIMEQAEYPAMSGSNTICTATVLINERLVPVTEPITELVLEAPAGLIRVTAEVRDGKARSITFENVPAFAASPRRAGGGAAGRHGDRGRGLGRDVLRPGRGGGARASASRRTRGATSCGSARW